MENRVWGELELNDRGNVSTIRLKKHKVFLGRSTKADLKVSHPQLSGLHCSLEWCQDSNRVSCVDKSSNGTHLVQNGQLMKMTKDSSYDLNDGDQIIFVKGVNESETIFAKFKKVNDPAGCDAENKEKSRKKVNDSFDESSPAKRRRLAISNSNANSTTTTIITASLSVLNNETVASEDQTMIAVNPADKKPICEHDEKAEKVETNTTQSLPVSNQSTSDTSMEEELLRCTICQEIFHEPVNANPCNHMFCAGCMSLWMRQSKNCPQCREPVKECREIHLIKEMVERYFQKHPDRRRSQEELEELNKANTITRNKPTANNNKPGRGRGRGGRQGARGARGMLGFHCCCVSNDV